MLELAILGLLKERNFHGYELKRRLSDALGLLSSLSFGSLYPALTRLEKQGAVKVVDDREEPPARIPMTGSLSGERAAYRAKRTVARAGRGGDRGRKVYGVTPEGERLFDELLTSGSPARDNTRSFNLRLAFARHLPPEARLRLLERRKAELVQRLAREHASAGTDTDKLDTYARSLMEHNRETAEHDISWLDRLIDAERISASSKARTSRTRTTAIASDQATITTEER